jgi:hypothetical protein
MARGWESKTVADQIESAERNKEGLGAGRLSFEQVEHLHKKEGLLLSRSRVLQELANARNHRYRQILEQKLSHLEQELARLAEPRRPPAG